MPPGLLPRCATLTGSAATMKITGRNVSNWPNVNVQAERVSGLIVQHERHEEHRCTKQNDRGVLSRRGQAERSRDRPRARCEQPPYEQPENRDGRRDCEQTARHVRAQTEQSEHRPQDQLRVFGQHEEQNRAAQFQEWRVQPSGQIRGQCATAQIRVEEAHHVRHGADGQQLAIRHAAVEPTNRNRQDESVPCKVEGRVRHHQGEELGEVRVVKRGFNRGEWHSAEDECKIAAVSRIETIR